MNPDESFVIGADSAGKAMVTTKGDVSKGLAEAAQIVDVEYATPFQHHNPMEMFSATAEWQGDTLTVWMPSQSVRTLHAGIVAAYGLQAASVRVIVPLSAVRLDQRRTLPLKRCLRSPQPRLWERPFA